MPIHVSYFHFRKLTQAATMSFSETQIPTGIQMCLYASALRLSQVSNTVDGLSSLLTGARHCLVNHTRSPTNGRCHAFQTPLALQGSVTSSGTVVPALQAPNVVSSDLKETLLSVLSQLLRGGRSRDPWRQQQLGPSSLVRWSNPGLPHSLQSRQCASAAPPGVILVHTAADSSLVISSPLSNSKLVISANLNQQLVLGLLSRFNCIPKTDGGVDLGRWIRSLVGAASTSRSSRPMLPGRVDTSDQRTALCLGGNHRVQQWRTVATMQEGRTALRKIGRKRAHCEMPTTLLPRKTLRMVASTSIPKVKSAVPSWNIRKVPVDVQGPGPSAAAAPKECVVLLCRLDLSDVKEKMVKRRLRWREMPSRSPPRKKPKLSVAALPVPEEVLR